MIFIFMYNKSLFLMNKLFKSTKYYNFNINKKMKKNDYNKIIVRQYSNNLPPPENNNNIWTFILIASSSVYISHHIFKK